MDIAMLRGLKRLPSIATAGSIALTIASITMACGASNNTCIRTGERIVLRGTVISRHVYGPPNFGETPNTDERRTIPVLVLNEPIDICHGAQDEINVSPVNHVTDVQLVDYSVRSTRRIEVSISGTLERAQNAFHYTPVFFIAD